MIIDIASKIVKILYYYIGKDIVILENRSNSKNKI